jgi:hypothetical protein
MSMKFTARLVSGKILTESDFESVSNLPLHEVEEIAIQHGDDPTVSLLVDVAAGEQVRHFVRHSIPIGNPELKGISVEVYEILKNEKTLCRLYWHPTKGPLLSSQDLYF